MNNDIMPDDKLLEYLNSSNVNPYVKTPFDSLVEQDPIENYGPTYTGKYMKEVNKYSAGMPLDVVKNKHKQQEWMNDHQSWLDQTGNALGQALIGEVIGGTLMSAGALLDTPTLANMFTKTEDDWHNVLFDLGNSISEWGQENMPIYRDPDKQGMSRFTDYGYYASMFPSVASAASMMIPGMGVAKGAAWAAKLANMSRLGEGIFSTLVGGVAMRHAENYREASGVYDKVLQDALDKGADEETARSNASAAAATDYSMNRVNLIFDIAQLGAVMKPFGAATRNLGRMSNAVAEAAGKIEPATGLKKIGRAFLDPGTAIFEQSSEGVEEMVNQIAQYEGEREGNILNGNQVDDGSNLMDRMQGYFGKAETWDAALWGVLGGVAFQQIGNALQGGSQEAKLTARKLDEIAARKTRTAAMVNALAEATKSGKEFSANYITDSFLTDINYQGVKAGNADLVEETYKSPQTLQMFVDAGVDENVAKQQLKRGQENLLYMEKEYQKLDEKYTGNQAFVGTLLNYRMMEKMYDDTLKEINPKIMKLEAEIASTSGSPLLSQLATLKSKLQSAQEVLKEEMDMYEAMGDEQTSVEDGRKKKDIKGAVDGLTQVVAALQNKYNSSLKDYQQLFPEQATTVDKDIDARSAQQEELHYLQKTQELAQTRRDHAIKEYNKLKDDPESLQKYVEEQIKKAKEKETTEMNSFLGEAKKKLDTLNDVAELNNLKNEIKSKYNLKESKALIKEIEDKIKNVSKQTKAAKAGKTSTATPTSKPAPAQEIVDEIAAEEEQDETTLEEAQLSAEEEPEVEGGEIPEEILKEMETAGKESTPTSYTKKDKYEKGDTFPYWDEKSNEWKTATIIGRADSENVMADIIGESFPDKVVNAYIDSYEKDFAEFEKTEFPDTDTRVEAPKHNEKNKDDVNEVLNLLGKTTKSGVTYHSTDTEIIMAFLSDIYRLAKTEDGTYIITDLVEDGHIVEVEGNDWRTSMPEFYKEGDEVVYYVYKGDIEKTYAKAVIGEARPMQYESLKNEPNAENVLPIAIQLKSDYEAGKPPKTFLHRADWIAEINTKNVPFRDEMGNLNPFKVAEENAEELLTKTLEIRRRFKDNHDEVITGHITAKTAGVARISPEVHNDIFTTFSNNGMLDSRVIFGIGKSELNIVLTEKNVHPTISNAELVEAAKNTFRRGVALAFVPSANGSYLPIYLQPQKVSDLEEEFRNEVTNTIADLLFTFAKNPESLVDLGITNFNTLREELNKFVSLTTGNIEKTDDMSQLIKVEQAKDGHLSVILRNTSKSSKTVPWIPYNVSTINLTKEKFTEVVKKALSDKYINISMHLLNPETFHFIKSGENGLEVSKMHYLKFLGQGNKVITNLDPKDYEGQNIYVSQPKILPTIEPVKTINIPMQGEETPSSEATPTTQSIEDNLMSDLLGDDYEGFNLLGKSESLTDEEIRDRITKALRENPKDPSILNIITVDSITDAVNMHGAVTSMAYMLSTIIDNFNDIAYAYNYALNEKDKQESKEKLQHYGVNFAEVEKNGGFIPKQGMGFFFSYLKNVELKNLLNVQMKVGNTIAASNIQKIIDNFDKPVFTEDNKIASVGYRALIQSAVDKFKFMLDIDEKAAELEEDNIVENLESGKENERGDIGNNRSFKIDPETSLSGKVRRLISSIYELDGKEYPDVNEDGSKKFPFGKPTKTAIGTVNYIDTAKVFHYLLNTLSNIPTDQMMERLHEAAAHNYIANEVYKKLNGDKRLLKPHELNQFITALNKQEAQFMMVIFDAPKTEDGAPGSRVFNSNRGKAEDILIQRWKENFEILGRKGYKDGSALLIEKDGELIINTEVGERIYQSYLGLQKEANYDVAVSKLAKLFGYLGINLDEKAIKRTFIAEKKIMDKRKRSGDPEFTFKHFLASEEMSKIFSTLSSSEKTANTVIEDVELSKNNPFYHAKTRLLKLAKRQIEFEPDIFSPSFRNADGETIYGFVNHHAQSTIMDKLVHDPKTIEQYAKDPFIKNNVFFKMLQESNDKASVLSLKYFDGARHSGKKGVSAKKFETMSEAEKEYARLALYYNNNNKDTMMFFGLPDSDKTTFPILTLPRLSIVVDMKGKGEAPKLIVSDMGIKLSKDSKIIDTLYNTAVLAEVGRINQSIAQREQLIKEAKTKFIANGGKAEDFKVESVTELLPQYHTGLKVGEMFFFFPILNQVVERYHETQKVDGGTPEYYKGQIELTDDVVNTIKETLVSELLTMTELRLKSWYDMGILEETKTKTGVVYTKSNLDERFIGYNKADTIGTSITISSKKDRNLAAARAVALEFTFNSILANVTDFQLVTKDPALYATEKIDNTVKKVVKAKEAHLGRELSSEEVNNIIIDEIAVNIFKRTAANIAPGEQGLWSKSEYKTLFVNEPKISSEGLKKLAEKYPELKDFVGKYSSLKAADAQEWTTLEEHLDSMYAFGKITLPQRNNILNRYKNNEGILSPEDMKVVMQPMKPVQVVDVYDDVLGKVVRYYIKTSSFPLIKQVAEPLGLKNMYDLMETHGIQRIVPESAVKVGYRKVVKLFDGGKIVDSKNFSTEEIKSKTITLNRSGFRKQQEVPHNPNKKEILLGSQYRKLRFANLSAEMQFTLPGQGEDVGPYSGEDLKIMGDNIFRLEYSRKLAKLRKTIGIPETGELNEIDTNKFREALIKAATDQEVDYNDLLTLSTVDINGMIRFDIPLIYSPMFEKVESLVNAMFKNNVLKQKRSGHSYVQGSPIGFTFTKEEDTEGILWAKGHHGDELSVGSDENGVYAEVAIPWNFKDKNGNLIPFTRENVDKVENSLLDIVGYRIPTQGHNSITRCKIVGFLPPVQGDLVVVAAEFVEMMGSDFDVDKLYVHWHNYNVYDDGAIKKLKYNLSTSEEAVQKRYDKYRKRVNENISFEEFSKLPVIEQLTYEQLQNLDLDITFAIQNHPDILSQRFTTLNADPLAEVIKKVNNLKGINEEYDPSKASQKNGLINTYHHDYIVEANSSGKIGIGSFSTTSVNHVAAQYANLYIGKKIVEIKGIPVELSNTNDCYIGFLRENGRLYEDKDTNIEKGKPANSVINDEVRYNGSPNRGAFRLDKIIGFSGKPILDIISYLQSASVDIAKENLLSPLNLNKTTFGVAGLLARAGFDEVIIGLFMSQPAIVEYVKRVNKAFPIIGTSTSVDNIMKGLLRELAIEAGMLTTKSESIIGSAEEEKTFNQFISKVHPIKQSEMEKGIAKLESPKYQATLQLAVLTNFLIYNNIAKDLTKTQKLLNTDTQFLDKTQFDSINKYKEYRKKFKKIYDSRYENDTLKTNIRNKQRLLKNRDGSTTISYEANEILKQSYEHMQRADMLPITMGIYSDSITEIFTDAGLDDRIDTQSEVGSKVIDIIRAYFYMQVAMNIYDTKYGDSPQIVRRDLLYDYKDNKSLGTLIAENRGRLNIEFLNRLSINNTHTKGQHITIEFPSSKQLDANMNLENVRGWLELLRSEDPVAKEIGEKLVLYTLIFGNDRNARDFGRFLPADYLKEIGFGDKLRLLNSWIGTGISNEEMSKQAKETGFKLYLGDVNMISLIKRAFFQHNPKLAYKLDYETLVAKAKTKSGKIRNPKATLNKKVADINVIDEFTIRFNDITVGSISDEDAATDEINDTEDAKIVGHEFISVFDTKNKVVLLYMFTDSTPDTVTYKLINTAGESFMTEILLRLDNKSVIKMNNISNLEPDAPIKTFERTEPKEKREETIFEKYNVGHNKPVTQIIESIATATGTINGNLAQYILKNHAGVLDTIKVVIDPKATQPSYIPSTNTIILPSKQSEFLESFELSIENDQDFEMMILHEVTHGLTIQAILNRSTNPKEVNEALNELEVLFNKLKTNKEFLSKLNKFDRIPFETEDFKEFVAHLFSNPNLIKVLNNTKVEGKSVLQQIIDAITKLLGININKNSELAPAINNVMTLMNNKVELKAKEEFKNKALDINSFIDNKNNIIWDKFEDLMDNFFKDAKYTLKNRPEHHSGETFTIDHIKNVVKSAQEITIHNNVKREDLIIASLLHDIGKPYRNENHGKDSFDIINTLFPKTNNLIKAVVLYHMIGTDTDINIFKDVLNHIKINNVNKNDFISLLKALKAVDITRGRKDLDLDDYTGLTVKEAIKKEELFIDNFFKSLDQNSEEEPTEREYTPENITKLGPNDVFVFGSNLGNSKGGHPTHGSGAALIAKQKFGAKQGQARGLQGQSYAIVTKKYWDVEKSSTLVEITREIFNFIDFAKEHPELKFYVTKIGSAKAGYTVEEMKTVFEKVNENSPIPDNVILPKEYEVRDGKPIDETTEKQGDIDEEGNTDITPEDGEIDPFENYDGGDPIEPSFDLAGNTGKSIRDIAMWHNVNTEGFFGKTVDVIKLRKDLVQNGFKHIRIKETRTGGIMLTENGKYFNPLTKKVVPSYVSNLTGNLGMSVGEFMKTLTKEERAKLRSLIEKKVIVTKCK